MMTADQPTQVSAARDAPDSGLDRRYRETVLATARVLLSIAGLAAVYIDPTEPEHFAGFAYGLLAAFVVYGVAVFVLLRTIGQPRDDRVAWVLHGADVVWAGAISLFTSGPNSAFFVFFVFVILAAAFRWRMRETMWTTFVLGVVLLAQAWLFAVDRSRFWLVDSVDINRLIMRSVYLLIVGFLAGYLAEKEKQSGVEAACIHDLVRALRTTLSFRQAVALVLSRLIEIFHARRGVLVLDDLTLTRAFLLELPARSGASLPSGSGSPASVEPAWREISRQEAARYFFPLPGRTAYIPEPGSRGVFAALDESGRRLPPAALAPLSPGVMVESGGALLVRDVPGTDQWRARAVLTVDARRGSAVERPLRLLHRIIENVAPVVYNVFLINRVRTRATAVERARVAREIHDGSLQSLSAIELQMQALERKSAPFPDVGWEVERIRQLLRDEISSLRDLMLRVRPLDVSARTLHHAISDLSERFQRERGVTVDFMTDGTPIDLSAATCREMFRIVQEALTNVRKHSRARNVVIRLQRTTASWTLTIEDDGRGFDFTGEMSNHELEAAGKGPQVIGERVHALGGTLTVISSPEHGSQLFILIPAPSMLEYV